MQYKRKTIEHFEIDVRVLKHLNVVKCDYEIASGDKLNNS